jgi:hypothetical protein
MKERIEVYGDPSKAISISLAARARDEWSNSPSQGSHFSPSVPPFLVLVSRELPQAAPFALAAFTNTLRNRATVLELKLRGKTEPERTRLRNGTSSTACPLCLLPSDSLSHLLTCTSLAVTRNSHPDALRFLRAHGSRLQNFELLGAFSKDSTQWISSLSADPHKLSIQVISLWYSLWRKRRSLLPRSYSPWQPQPSPDPP